MAGERRWLMVILGVALVLRLGWGLSRPTGDDAIAALPDQAEYLSLGRSLLHGGTLSFHDPRFDQTVYAYRTPGYPAFVALCGGSPLAVRLAQAVVDTSTVLATYLLARRWLGGVGSLAAAGIVAVNPLLIYFTGLVLSETVYTATLAWGIYLVTLPRGWLVGVGVLVIGVLVRPAGIGLVVVLPALGVWVNRGGWGAYLYGLHPALARVGDGWACGPTAKPQAAGRGDRLESVLVRAGVRAVVAAGILLVVLGVWAWRNERVLGQRVWLTTNEGITRYDGFNERADGSSNQWFVKEMPRLKDMDELQRDELFSQMAASYISDHPARVVELAVRKVGRTWSPWPLSEQFGSAKYVAVGLVYSTPFFLLVLLGIWMGPIPRSAKLLLLVPALYFTVVHAFSVGSLRYRVPVEPGLAILAGSAVSLLLPLKTGNQQRAASDR